MSQTTDVGRDILTAIGLLTGQPEVIAAGAALSATSKMIEGANDPSIQAVMPSAIQASDLSGGNNNIDQWQIIETQLNDFQGSFTDASSTQSVDSSTHITYDDNSLLHQMPTLTEFPIDHHHHHQHHSVDHHVDPNSHHHVPHSIFSA